MSLHFIKRIFISKLVAEGSKTPLIQRLAKKTAQMERNLPEKIALWASAAYAEAKSDAVGLWSKAQAGSSGRGTGTADKKQVLWENNSNNTRRD